MRKPKKRNWPSPTRRACGTASRQLAAEISGISDSRLASTTRRIFTTSCSATAGEGDRDGVGKAQRVGLVDFHLGVAHRGMCHHQVEDFLGHALEQGEAVQLHMANDRLGDGSVVECLLD